MKAIQITLDEALLARLDASAEVRRDGRSAVLRRAAEEYLKRRRRRAIADQYTKDTAKHESSPASHSKVEYQDLYNKMREATLAALDPLDEAAQRLWIGHLGRNGRAGAARAAYDRLVERLRAELDTEPEPDPSTTDGLIRLIEMQQDRIIAVGTGRTMLRHGS